MIDHYYAVIMAGGGGTRLWPLSRQQRPKQMLQIGNGRTLFQTAVERLKSVFPPERILVVTVEEQAAGLRKQCPQLPAENFLIEPMPRGTASVVGLAAVAVSQRDPRAVLAVLTADHFIQNVDYFCHLLESAYPVAESGFLVTLGIRPTYPATGYGYVQRGGRLGEFSGAPVYRVLSFKEKPDQTAARSMVASGDHDWNSGMFFWRADRILEEIEHWMPALSLHLRTIINDWRSPTRLETLTRVWPLIRPETIDYGIMEKAERVAVLPATDLGWNDVGSWDSLFEVLQADQNDNIVMQGRHIGIDTHESLVCSESGRLIVTIGVENLILVDTGDALLVCSREQSQKVRQVVDLLKKSGDKLYL